MRKLTDLSIILPALMVIVIVMFLMLGGDRVGLPSTVLDEFLGVLPALITFVVGLVILTRMRGFYLIGGFGLIGISVALLISEANTAGLVTTEMLSGLTVSQVETWVVIIFTALGGVAGRTGR